MVCKAKHGEIDVIKKFIFIFICTIFFIHCELYQFNDPFANTQAKENILTNDKISNSIIIIKVGTSEITNSTGSYSFGTCKINNSTDQTFIIENTGSDTLSLTGSPYVQLTSGDIDSFQISNQPATANISISGSIFFTVRFIPTSSDTKTATIQIESNGSSARNIYTFTVTGTGTTISISDINLKQGSTDIIDGSGTCDFGTQTVNTAGSDTTFIIENTGIATLSLIGSPIVQLISGDTGEFSISNQPVSSSIAASGSTTFTICFSPTAPGAKSATVQIDNNDPDAESTYTFEVTGTGLDDTVPAVSDGTITISSVNYNSVDLSWTKATDNYSDQSDLQYLVYYSTSDNIQNLTDIESNGTAFGSYTTDINSLYVNGLEDDTQHYFNIIVKDEAGKQSCYTSNSDTTLACGLIQNPGFEQDTTDWNTSWGNNAISSDANTGSNAIRAGTGAGGVYQIITSGISASSTYTFSVYGKVSDVSELGHVFVIAKNASDTELENRKIPFFSTTYEQKEITFDTPAGTTKIEVNAYKYSGSEYFYADDYSLTEDAGATADFAWEFDVDEESWTAGKCSIAVADSILTVTADGVNTGSRIKMSGLSLDASKYSKFKVVMKNDSKFDQSEFFWKRTIDANISSTRTVKITVSTFDTEYTEYTFDLSSHALWNGTIEDLRFDPVDNQDLTIFVVDIARIMFTE